MNKLKNSIKKLLRPASLKFNLWQTIQYNLFYRKWDYIPEFSTPKSVIINQLVKKFEYKKYLEIGVSEGKNFEAIDVDYKVGVDPHHKSAATVKLTSDDFFKRNSEQFDIIFIDGLHVALQVYHDILASLEVLNEGGVILCHDMNPWNKAVQDVLRKTLHWTGDCWKAFVRLRMERDDLEMCVIDTDCGIGFIKRGKLKKLNIKCKVNWKNFSANRVKWLNLISVDKFYDRFVAR